jgi:hypothetical protein
MPALTPVHKGYAFDKPAVLVQQRLFGLAHGVTLLVSTCLADGSATNSRDSILEAYAKWDSAQAHIIEELQGSLSSYYFAERSAAAKWADIAAALNLPAVLALKPGSLEMMAACDSLPETLQKPRYDLERQYRLQRLAARLAAATTTEALADACRASLPDEAAQSIEEGMQRWREAYGTLVSDARATLEQQWDDAQLDGNLEDWLAQARGKGQRAAKAKFLASTKGEKILSCNNFSAWLLTGQANPDDEFDSRP